MVPQGQYLNLYSCTVAQHFSLHKNKLLVPRGNQLLRHSWKTPSTLLLWRLHTLVNVLLIILTLGTDSPIHLGRNPAMNECAGVQLTCQQCDPFPTQMYTAREDTTFVVEIGPSANPRGYTGITGMHTV